jgi:Smg protein
LLHCHHREQQEAGRLTTTMREKIVEIIVYLMGELRNNIPLGEIDLSVLTNSGYTPTEISTAFSWLYEKIDLGENLVKEISKSSPHSHRVLHDAERMVFTPEAHGYLIQLRELGLISEEDIEAVIDRVMLADYVTAGMQETKSIVASILLESEDSRGIGSRIMFNGRDTIH